MGLVVAGVFVPWTSVVRCISHIMSECFLSCSLSRARMRPSSWSISLSRILVVSEVTAPRNSTNRSWRGSSPSSAAAFHCWVSYRSFFACAFGSNSTWSKFGSTHAEDPLFPFTAHSGHHGRRNEGKSWVN